MTEYRKIAKSDAQTRGESSQYVIKNYVTKDTSPRVSLAVSRLQGVIPMTMNTVSDRVYYFVSGAAVVSFPGGRQEELEAGDVLYISHQTQYSVRGTFEAVLINAPAFDLANEKPVEGRVK